MYFNDMKNIRRDAIYGAQCHLSYRRTDAVNGVHTTNVHGSETNMKLMRSSCQPFSRVLHGSLSNLYNDNVVINCVHSSPCNPQKKKRAI